MPRKPKTDGQSRQLRRQRGPCHTADPQAHPQHEPDVQAHVQPVLQQLQPQHRAGAFDRDQPAGDGVKPDGRRCTPDADGQIVAGQCFHRVRCRGQPERGPEDRHLQRDKDEPRHRRYGQRPQQMRANLGLIARAVALRHQPRCAHAQKPEDPIDRGQDDRADAHRPDRFGQAQLAHDAGIDQPQQRHGQVRQDDGKRDVQHAPMCQQGTLHLMAAASGNARSPAQSGERGCPATPRHGPRRSASPSARRWPAHRRRAAGPSAGNRR